jgi:mannose-1-phosphate guanylyltransferase
MKIVLLSGGSGKRLWPLSNDSRSKQFLRLLGTEGNIEGSMVQRVYKQLIKFGFEKSTIIATSKSQVDMIQNQLGMSVPLVIEPERKDTFAAIALSCAYMLTEEMVSEDEVIIVMPVDLYVEDKFFREISCLEDIILKSISDIALLGVYPTFPSNKYGYIVPEIIGTTERHNKVSYFKEKPDTGIAKELMNEGALWNCGVFAFRLGFLISLLKSRNLPIGYNDLLNKYSELPQISFDYSVLEASTNVSVIPYHGKWKDLGTWDNITEEMPKSTIGNVNVSDECQNIHVINELDIPMAILGISDAVVVASPDGILVSSKKESPRIKDLIQFDQRPMYEERRWGWYKVLDFTYFHKGYEVLTKRICVKAGKNLSYQYHHKRSEVWTIISGIGEFVLNDELISVSAGSVLNIAQGDKHGIRAITDLEFIEVQTGSHLIEEDIVRVCMKWEDIILKK